MNNLKNEAGGLETAIVESEPAEFNLNIYASNKRTNAEQCAFSSSDSSLESTEEQLATFAEQLGEGTIEFGKPYYFVGIFSKRNGVKAVPATSLMAVPEVK